MKRLSYFVTLLLFPFIFFSCYSSFGDDDEDEPEEDNSPRIITIEGVVKDYYTQAPMAHAKLKFERIPYSNMHTFPDSVLSVYTDSLGMFSIKGNFDVAFSSVGLVCSMDSVVKTGPEFYTSKGQELVYDDAVQYFGIYKNAKHWAEYSLKPKSFVSYKIKSKDGQSDKVSFYFMINGDTIFTNPIINVPYGPMRPEEFKLSRIYTTTESINIAALVTRGGSTKIYCSKRITPVPGKVSLFYLEY